jgi:hypothetical protein
VVLETEKFSYRLETWLKSNNQKTLKDLDRVFAEKSFAIIIMILMAIPALPLPTGGVTHVFEIIVMLICLEMVAGRKTLWLPKKWKNMKLGSAIEKKTLPVLVRRIRWLEQYSKPRGKWMLNNQLFLRVTGVLIFVLALTAFLAPPFSGLDTLPALGALLIALSIILDDALFLMIGLIVGGVGVGLVVGLSKVVLHFISGLF